MGIGATMPLWVWLKLVLWFALGGAIVVLKRTPQYATLMFFLLPLYVAPIELTHDDDVGAIESIQNSFRIFSGFRLPAFLVALFCMFFAFFGMIACCLPALVTVPMAHMIFCSLYLALRNGSGLPPARRR